MHSLSSCHAFLNQPARSVPLLQNTRKTHQQFSCLTYLVCWGSTKLLQHQPACTSLPWYAELAKGRVASGVRYDGGPSSESNADKAEGKPDWTGPAEQFKQLINCMNSATDGLPGCSYHYLQAHGLAV